MSKIWIFGIFWIFAIFGMVFPGNALGAVAGDVDGSKGVDLQDVIVSLQVCSEITPSSYVYKKYEASGDSKIGIEETIYALQVTAGIRPEETIWYKDADGDQYSDGATMISETRPSNIYFDESELIATSGDTDDNDANVHPRAEQLWVTFDDTQPSTPDIPPDINVPVSTTKEVVIEYSIPGMYGSESPEDNTIYDILNIPGCGYTDDIGKPQLPVVRRYVAVPQGASISTEIITRSFRDISGFTVHPHQEPPSDIADYIEPPFEISTDVYQLNSFYPSEIIQLEGPVVIRGVSTVIVQIHPVQFNPTQQKLRVYSNISVKLTFSGGTRNFRNKRFSSASYDTILNRIILNNQFLSAEKDARAAYDSGNSLLIITHPDFLNAANTLRAWKIKKGIYTEVRTTRQTGSTAAAIQNYIKTAYETWSPPPTYVLLIGDAEFIPTHYKTWHTHNYKPRCDDCQGMTGTDLYYSTVDGDDYFPDISIGRLSVDTLTQANKRVNDIINYERTPVTDSNFYHKAAICAYFQDGGGGNAERRFAQTSEDIAIYLSNEKYLGRYAVDRIYLTKSLVMPKKWTTKSWSFSGGPAGNSGDPIPSYLMKPGFAWDGDSNDITNAINDGRFLVTHRDHGAASGWDDPDYRTWNVEDLTNGNKLPVVWSINCQTGWFDNETDDEKTGTSESSIHFSEAWERNEAGGAIGVIAPTRVSNSGHNDRLVWGWMDALWPNFENSYAASGTAFDEPVYEMGPVLNYGKYYHATKYAESANRKNHFEMFHWFGDPTMQLWTDTPQNLSVSHVSSLDPDATSIQVTANQADAIICVSKDDEILARAKSNGGSLTLSWATPLVEGDTIAVTVTKHNFRPYEKQISVCTYSISPANKSFSSFGGTGSIAVAAPAGCAWTAIENLKWLTITSGSSGNGEGIVVYSVFSNTSNGSRTGEISIAGKKFTVTQEAAAIIETNYSGRISDTGQTECYNFHHPNVIYPSDSIPCPQPGEDYYGQDGNYLINPPSFTKLDANGNILPDSATSWDMVQDNITGLVWEIKQNNDDIKDYSNPHDADNTYTWYNSNAYPNSASGSPGDGTDTEDFINDLNRENFGGYSNWRLPTIEELRSIMNYRIIANNTPYTIPSPCLLDFPNSKSSSYWSSTSYADNIDDAAWSGSCCDCTEQISYKSESKYVRAVHGSKPWESDQLFINGDGTVTDGATGLMWEQNVGDTTMTWKEGLSYCQNLSLAGYSDWRLPNIKELASITDLDNYDPALDISIFPNIDTNSYNRYWSSTTKDWNNNWQWFVEFKKGEINHDIFAITTTTVKRFIRAVRGGQPQISEQLYITSPAQASSWTSGEVMPIPWQADNEMPIIWETEGISGNVRIALSRDGGKNFSETIASSTPNDGFYNWTVTGPTSVNCFLKITPLNAPSKETKQGLFSIVQCSYNISPASKTFTASGGSGNISVNAPGGCDWKTTESSAWITIIFEGLSSVNYTVASNPSTDSRTGTITIGDQIFTITQNGVTPPDTPSAVEASALSETSIEITWNDNSDNETGFSIWRWIEEDWVKIDSVSANTTSYVDTDLISGTTYYYIVGSYNDAGANFSDHVECTTPFPPVAPSGVQAVALSENSIKIIWNDNSDNEKGFSIWRWIAEDWVNIGSVSANTTSYVDVGLTSGTTYYYIVGSYNDAGANYADYIDSTIP